jgi:hypothetical protein
VEAAQRRATSFARVFEADLNPPLFINSERNWIVMDHPTTYKAPQAVGGRPRPNDLGRIAQEVPAEGLQVFVSALEISV